jgi:hypothetical protein
MNALRTAQKESPLHLTQNSLDPAIAVKEVLSGAPADKWTSVELSIR